MRSILFHFSLLSHLRQLWKCSCVDLCVCVIIILFSFYLLCSLLLLSSPVFFSLLTPGRQKVNTCAAFHCVSLCVCVFFFFFYYFCVYICVYACVSSSPPESPWKTSPRTQLELVERKRMNSFSICLKCYLYHSLSQINWTKLLSFDWPLRTSSWEMCFQRVSIPSKATAVLVIFPVLFFPSLYLYLYTSNVCVCLSLYPSQPDRQHHCARNDERSSSCIEWCTSRPLLALAMKGAPQSEHVYPRLFN